VKQDLITTGTSFFETAALKLFYSRAARNLFTNAWYSLLSNLDRHAAVTFLNYGYASSNGEQIPLRAEDEPNRYPIQLYHHVLSGTAVAGREVLEVGSGRGGGASYVARYFRPRTFTGVDICKAAIRFSRARYADQDNLEFRVADACNLPFANDSFDVVLNVESAQHYGDMGQFLEEVYRVLRPGGDFLMACFEDVQKNVLPREFLRQTRLRLIREDDITANVARALELDGSRRQELAIALSPRLLLGLSKEFAGIPGTQLHASFANGECPYFCFACRKE
jgi:SAM-dependent methyltransferase